MKNSILLTAAACSALTSFATAAAFTPGNLIVMRIGDGSATITNAATAVFLDEYQFTATPSPAVTFVQTVAVPSTGASALTVSGTATSEGVMSPAQDGTRIFIGGYRKDAGGTNPVSDAPATTNRVIGSIAADGTINTSIAVTDATGNCRAAVGAGAAGAIYIATNGGIRYAASPGAATTTTLIDTRNSRQLALSGNVLYASNGTTILPKVQQYGTLPTVTTAATAVISLTSGDAVQGFWLADLSDSVAGADTLYVASATENRLRKYSLVSGAWADSGAIAATGILNLTGISTAGSPERTASLFYSTATASTGQCSVVIDASGYNMSLTATPVTLLTAGTNKAFRGISAFPAAASPAWQFAGSSVSGTDLTLTWTGTPGVAPFIQFSPDLVTWNPLEAATEGPAGTYKVVDPDGEPRRFYRIAP